MGAFFKLHKLRLKRSFHRDLYFFNTFQHSAKQNIDRIRYRPSLHSIVTCSASFFTFSSFNLFTIILPLKIVYMASY